MQDNNLTVDSYQIQFQFASPYTPLAANVLLYVTCAYKQLHVVASLTAMLLPANKATSFFRL
jgi:hypothetical protein